MQKACGKQITCDKVVQYKLHAAFSLGSRGYFFSLIILQAPFYFILGIFRTGLWRHKDTLEKLTCY